MLKYKLALVGAVALLAIALVVVSAISTRSADAAISAPKVQFFHTSLTGQTLPDNGTTTVATLPSTTTQKGALDVVSLQDVTMNGTCCATLGQDATITAMVYLDGTQLASVSRSTGNGGAFPTTIDMTTTHVVSTGSHTLTVVYVTSTNPNPPPIPGQIVTRDGTLSLAIATPATSN